MLGVNVACDALCPYRSPVSSSTCFQCQRTTAGEWSHSPTRTTSSPSGGCGPAPQSEMRMQHLWKTTQIFCFSLRHHTYKKTDHRNVELTEVGPRFEMKRKFGGRKVPAALVWAALKSLCFYLQCTWSNWELWKTRTRQRWSGVSTASRTRRRKGGSSACSEKKFQDHDGLLNNDGFMQQKGSNGTSVTMDGLFYLLLFL